MRKLAIMACATGALVLTACTGTAQGPAANASVVAPALTPGSSSSARPTPSATGAGASGGTATFGDFVRARQPQLQFCYEETRARHPKLAGSATVSVTINPDGKVKSTEIIRRSWSGKGSKDVEGCVLNKVRSWRFSNGMPDELRTQSFVVIFNR